MTLRSICAISLLLSSGPVGAFPQDSIESVREQLVEIPEPNFEGADADVAADILARLEATRTLAASVGAGPTELAKAYGELGQTFLLYDLLEPAEAAFENVLLVTPGDHRAHYYLGVIAQELRRIDEARTHLQAVVDIDPRYLSALIRLGDLELAANQLDVAQSWYERALEVYPASPAAHWGLGQLASSRGDPAAAVEHFEAVLANQPQASAVHYPLALAYRELGQMDKAREHIALRGERPVQPLDPLIDGLVERIAGASLFMNRGNQAFSRGQYEMASDAYRKAVEADPDNAVARHALATSLSRQGLVEEAAEQLRTVLEQDPENAVAQYNLATMYSEMGDLERALPHYERAVELSPDLTNARFNLGILLQRRGRFEEALEQFVEVRRLDPQDTGAAIRHAAILAQLGRPDEAEAELTRVLSVNPDDIPARLALGGTLAAAGRLGEAIEAYRRVLEIDQSPEAQARGHFEIGRLHLASGDPAAAVEAIAKTVELMPTIVDARMTLANALARTKRFGDAVEQFEIVIQQRADMLDAHLGLALALLLDGQDRRAKTRLEASLFALPNEPELLHMLGRLLATSADETVRDGARALTLAQRVRTMRDSPSHAETVAMALAELGRFEEAQRLQSDVHRRATAVASPDLAAIETRLRQYERGEPVRSPWLDAD